MIQHNLTLHSVFPCPVYNVKRDSNLTPEEEKEIGTIVKEGMKWISGLLQQANDTYIFDTKLKNLKEFIEQHIKNYVKEIINPKKELDFYITQSWLNVIKPGGNVQQHSHANSIISGVFYISTGEGDKITFTDPNIKLKEMIKFKNEEYNLWNSTYWSLPSKNNELMLFPSWLNHQVIPNEKATTDRISISFNTFVKGTLGFRKELTELILK